MSPIFILCLLIHAVGVSDASPLRTLQDFLGLEPSIHVAAAEVDPVACQYHMSLTATNTCSNSNDYPEEWAQPENRIIFFFETSEECCNMYFGEGCVVVEGEEC